MSWYEDNLEGLEGMIDGEVRLTLDEESLRLFWKTKDKKEIFIEDMETEHIRNICRAGISGKINIDEKTEDRFLLELSLRIKDDEIPRSEVLN